MKSTSTSLFLLLCMMTLSFGAEEPTTMRTLQPGDHALTFTSTYDQTRQPFRLYLPRALKEGKPLPLVIVLHGKYVDQNAWFDHTPIKAAAEEHGYIAAAPHSRGNWFYRGPGEQDVFDIIDLLKSNFPIDEDRVYLMGHSMGGWGTWWLAAKRPEVWATICPMAAMPPIELMGNMAPLDPLIIHSIDDDVVDISNSRWAVNLLTINGISYRYIAERGYGHSSQMIGDNFDRIFAWLKEHHRNPHPARVFYKTRRFPAGAWWIRILESNQPPDHAWVEAEWKNAGSLVIRAENVSRFAIIADALPTETQWPATLEINGLTQELSRFEGAAEINQIKPGVGFNIEIKTLDALLPKTSPVIGTLAADFPTTDSGFPHVAPVTTILKLESEADYVLLHRDMFRLPARAEITEAEALDLYIYPNDIVCSFEAKGAELIALEKEESALYNIEPLDPKPDPDQLYRVVAPDHIARRFTSYPVNLKWTISEYIYDHIKRTGQWP